MLGAQPPAPQTTPLKLPRVDSADQKGEITYEARYFIDKGEAVEYWYDPTSTTTPPPQQPLMVNDPTMLYQFVTAASEGPPLE